MVTSTLSYYVFTIRHALSAVLVAISSIFTTTLATALNPFAHNLPTALETTSATIHAATQGHDTGTGHSSHLEVLNSADILMILFTISVILRVLNFHFFQIPSSVAMAFGAILMTLCLLILSYIPWLGVSNAIDALRALLKDFPDLVLKYMLGFLLFSAAIEVDLRNLGRIFSTVLALSVVSTLLSTFIVGILTYLLMQNIAHMDLTWCLLFGAIVSPTDPVTVISILNDKPDLLPSSTRYFVVGESLLNDAVGVVLYLVLLEIVQRPDIGSFEIATLLFQTLFIECMYGIVIGVFLAWLAYSAIVSVREPLLEVIITFVLVININMICRILDASIPLASVGAGLFIGNYAVTFAMDDETSETFHELWKLADETLNSILFLMIGAADLFWNPQDLGWVRVILLVICTISISIVARFLAVALPLLTIILLEWLTGRRLRHVSVRYRGGTIAVLTWAGMRGGISIALALGVPDSFVKHAVPGHMTYGQLIFFMTFILVVFSILVQGMLFEPVVKMINRASFELFASGGLSTYVSSQSLGNGLAGIDMGEPDYVTPEDSFMSNNEPLWDVGGQQVYQDFNAGDSGPGDGLMSQPEEGDGYGTMSTAPGMGEVGGRPAESTSTSNAPSRYGSSFSRGDFGRFASDMVMDRRNNSQYSQYGGRGYGGHMGADHERQGSITFRDLPSLEEPPSIPAFFSSLQKKGTHSFARWFDLTRGRATTPPDSSENRGLRRSRTEPDNARLARGEGNSSEEAGDQNPQLSSVSMSSGRRVPSSENAGDEEVLSGGENMSSDEAPNTKTRVSWRSDHKRS